MYFSRGRCKMEKNALENLGNKKVYVAYKTFTRKYYYYSQSKKGLVSLIAQKKTGWLLGEGENALHKNVFDVSSSVFR